MILRVTLYKIFSRAQKKNYKSTSKTEMHESKLNILCTYLIEMHTVCYTSLMLFHFKI